MAFLFALLFTAGGVALSVYPPETLGVRAPGHWVWLLWSGSLQLFVLPLLFGILSLFFRPWGVFVLGFWFLWTFFTTVLFALFSWELASAGQLNPIAGIVLIGALGGAFSCVRALLPHLNTKDSDPSVGE